MRVCMCVYILIYLMYFNQYKKKDLAGYDLEYIMTLEKEVV